MFEATYIEIQNVGTTSGPLEKYYIFWQSTR